ncbi:MAG: hypothetical protein Q8J88_04955 [Bacteroidales bacterium]|nr:hypothetical protein [Bacteroidales bacterium]
MANKTVNTFPKTISVIFHPLLIPTWAFLIVMAQGNLYFFQIPAHAKWLVAAMVFTISGAVPAMIILLMYRLKMISALSIPIKEERAAPIIITALFFYLTYYLLKQLQIAPIFGFYMLGATTLAILSLFINLWWKISLHLTAMGGLVGAFVGLSLLVHENYLTTVISAVLLAGIVAYSRLKLSAHNPLQVYAGFITGFGLMYFLVEVLH